MLKMSSSLILPLIVSDPEFGKDDDGCGRACFVRNEQKVVRLMRRFSEFIAAVAVAVGRSRGSRVERRWMCSSLSLSAWNLPARSSMPLSTARARALRSAFPLITIRRRRRRRQRRGDSVRVFRGTHSTHSNSACSVWMIGPLSRYHSRMTSAMDGRRGIPQKQRRLRISCSSFTVTRGRPTI